MINKYEVLVMLVVPVFFGVLLSEIGKAESSSSCRRIKRIVNNARIGGGKQGEVVFHTPPQTHKEVLKTAVKLLESESQCSIETVRKLSELLIPIGFEAIKVNNFIVLREQKNAKRGGGVYVFNCNSSAPIVVQVPHSFYDKHTLKIGFKLFCSASARWLMVNTLHRYRAYKGEPKDADHPADCAHNTNTLFQAITAGIVEYGNNPLFVQLHGFKKDTKRNFDLVVSSGKTPPNECAKQVFNKVSATVNKPILYSSNYTDTKLGGTTNVQGNLIRKKDGRFVHIEMSEDFRQKLLNELNTFKVFQTAIVGAAHDCSR